MARGRHLRRGAGPAARLPRPGQCEGVADDRVHHGQDSWVPLAHGCGADGDARGAPQPPARVAREEWVDVVPPPAVPWSHREVQRKPSDWRQTGQQQEATNVAIQFGSNAPEYVGAVLALREANYYDDSDFYAYVWDGERIAEVCYNTTRAGMDGRATVDATDAVKDAANGYIVRECRRILRIDDAERAKDAVVVGREVTINRGRKYPKGTTGIVKRVWERRSAYGTWHQGYRLLLATPTGDIWVDADNVDVTDPWDNISTDAEIEASAQGMRGRWDYQYSLIYAIAHSGRQR